MESQTFAISGCERPTTVQDILCRIVQLIASPIGIIVQTNVRYSPKRLLVHRNIIHVRGIKDRFP
jgi:hypothetical protein